MTGLTAVLWSQGKPYLECSLVCAQCHRDALDASCLLLLISASDIVASACVALLRRSGVAD